MTRTTLLAAATAVVLTLSACADTGDGATTAPTASPDTTAQDGSEAQDGSGAETGGDEAEPSMADVRFARMMIPHHEQAIEMSDIILARDDVPDDVRDLAEHIKADQAPEIEQFERWLEQWGEPTGPRGDHGGHGMGDRSAGDMGEDMGERMGDQMGDADGMGMMDGMLSPREMQELSDAEGADAVRLFLERMIDHHEGAIDMAEAQVADGTYPPAVDLAREIIATQQREIDDMRGMLTAS
ncbi:DUF305 domain-containing protein [Dietzia sp. PP-33]|jgi:uncharacterized protein (DUF305 family)|uniref:DUF305 domain-containing protein n=1 Tax=Dietzia sp. PP-33 TaxID=2957500 RepID=UPI0029AF7CF9|nr:DUF305 domain-containing protein [Dietzia sp. PP-33]MDX2358378.1 DUF305 domain-containing protein [Dietzia sp. PP-33]